MQFTQIQRAPKTPFFRKGEKLDTYFGKTRAQGRQPFSLEVKGGDVTSNLIHDVC